MSWSHCCQRCGVNPETMPTNLTSLWKKKLCGASSGTSLLRKKKLPWKKKQQHSEYFSISLKKRPPRSTVKGNRPEHSWEAVMFFFLTFDVPEQSIYLIYVMFVLEPCVVFPMGPSICLWKWIDQCYASSVRLMWLDYGRLRERPGNLVLAGFYCWISGLRWRNKNRSRSALRREPVDPRIETRIEANQDILSMRYKEGWK